MPKTKHRLGNVAIGLSFALCVLAVLLQVATIFRGVWIGLYGPTNAHLICVGSGSLCFRLSKISPDPALPATSRWRILAGTESEVGSECFGVNDPSFWSKTALIETFQAIPYDSGDGLRGRESVSSRTIFIPLWLLAAGAAVPPALYWKRRAAERRQRRWEAAGLCYCCGYDLRATPGQCPECGANRRFATFTGGPAAA
jgi:hypothetical protein